MPKSLFRSKRAAAVAIAATVAAVSSVALVSGQSTTARAAVAPGTTVRASVVDGPDATQSPEGGSSPELSADGTAVTFTSRSKLDDLDTGGHENVYVRDLRNNRTVMISRGQLTRPEPPPPSSTTPPPTTDITIDSPPRLAGEPKLSLNGRRQPPPVVPGEVPPSDSSYAPTISADGRYVAFVTWADNIVSDDDDDDSDILVCDRDPDGDGEFDETRTVGEDDEIVERDYTYFRVTQPQWQSTSSGGRYRVDDPRVPKLSDDASRLVWEDDYVEPSGLYLDVVRTAVLRQPGGAVGKPKTTEIIDTRIGDQPPTRQWSPDVSGDGAFVVLVASFVRVEGDIEFPTYISYHAVLRKDMRSGAVLRVDWDTDTTPEKPTYLSADETVRLDEPAISANGGEIAFEAEEYEDVCSDGCWYSVADQPMVFVVRIDAENRPVDSIVASRDNDNEIVNGFSPSLSGDGRFVAFGTDNVNAHDGVDFGTDDYSCLNRGEGDLRGKPMVNLSGLPPTSEARDERTVCQVVVRDLVVDRERLRTEQTRLPGTLVSAGTGEDCAEELPAGESCAGNGDSPPYRVPPTLSHNGSTVAFDSQATNLVPNVVDDNRATDVFVRTFRPELKADPSPLEFGEVELGDTFDQVVRFDHVGTGPLTIEEITIEGTDEFALGAQTCLGEAVILQQTGSCEVSVTFAPTTAADRTGTLRVTLRDGREFTVPLRGKGTKEELPPPADARFAAGPDPLNFGDRLLLSDGPTQTVTVTNVGGSPLTITDVAIVSTVALADYTIATDTCSDIPLRPNGTCQVTVRFSPTASGDRPAVLRFVDNAPGGDAHLIGLAGKGGTPVLQLSPAVTQPGRVVTVTGTGFAPNRTVAITVAGSPETATAVADATGAFSQALLIFPKSSVGNRLVTGTIDGTALKAERPLLIVTPTVTPADFVVRG
ncbi:choice-of-anchor D domain-containing protein [Actinophytocola sp.]|uniref:choice-of-anchor D domain-containing protein n=1 Tax=Actinophytocola sp. TaxID=1872138 RepID=UPI002ED2D31A